MKKILSILVFLILSVSVFADIDFTINNAPLKEEYVLSPGESLSVDVSIAPGILVKDIVVDAEKHYYESLFDSLSDDYRRSPVVIKKTVSVDVPETVPSGSSRVDVEIFYEDHEFNKNSKKYSTTINIEDGSGVLGFAASVLPDRVVDEVMGEFKPANKPIRKELSFDDLSKEDFSKLGLSFENVNDAKISKKNERSFESSFDDAKEKVREFKKEVKGKIKLKPKITVTDYIIEYNGITIEKSKSLIEIPAGLSLSKLNAVVFIPKSVAANAKLLSFSERPIILKEDPVIKWSLSHMKQGDSKQFAVVGDVSDENISVAASADKMSWLTKLIMLFVG